MKNIAVIFMIACVAYSNAAIIRSLKDIRAFEDFLRSTVNGKPTEPRIPGLKELQNEEENSGKYEGDIILSEEQIQEMVDEYAGRNGVTDKTRMWPNGIIYYDIAPSTFTAAQKSAIEAAVDDINRSTCVRIKRRTSSNPHYILVTGNTDGGCSASLGYTGKAGQKLNLKPNTPGSGCFRHGTIILL